ncbi:hypothetical protein ACHQM5_009726 [Ranunculus cassubicifolius]
MADSSFLDLSISAPGSNNVRGFDMNEVPAVMVEDEDDDSSGCGVGANGGKNKKLRLTKEQSRLLEASFRENHTLNAKQKDALANQMGLKPRQVEVWFQNRRARTKLKQTEMECEYLKRCFGTLTEENKRLHREVEQLRALKTVSGGPHKNPNQQSPSMLTMCPRCERVTKTKSEPDNGPTNSRSLSVHVFRHSRQSSAAC